MTASATDVKRVLVADDELNMRRVLEAMGAKLKIIAEFPDGEIVISQFHQKARGKARA